jgi:GPN-loop GTPase
VAMRNESSLMEVQDIQERWIDNKDEYDKIERAEEEEQAKVREAQARAAEEATGGLSLQSATPSSSSSGIKVARKKK